MPSRAKEPPSYTGTAEEPRVSAPPCSHTRTGSRAPGSGEGVQTLRLRQSSPGISGSDRYWANASEYGGFGAVGPKVPASRSPSQGSGGSGGRNRRGPTGGAAYGMPRNTATPRSYRPRTAPYGVRTTGSARSVPAVGSAWSAVITHHPFTARPCAPCAHEPVHCATTEHHKSVRYSGAQTRGRAVRVTAVR